MDLKEQKQKLLYRLSRIWEGEEAKKGDADMMSRTSGPRSDFFVCRHRLRCVPFLSSRMTRGGDEKRKNTEREREREREK